MSSQGNLMAILFFLFSLAFVLSEYSFNRFSQEKPASIVKNANWISERYNLNITLKLVPAGPIIDETTELLFKVTYLNNSKPFEDLNTRVTITDHDGRLYKFENKLMPVIDGHFSVNYIFPDDGDHRIIAQLYKNTTPITVSSFDLAIPHPIPPSDTYRILKSFADFFNNFT